jgi:hypothetical protein
LEDSFEDGQKGGNEDGSLRGGNLDIDGLGVKLGSDKGSEDDFEDGGRDGTEDDSSLGFK